MAAVSTASISAQASSPCIQFKSSSLHFSVFSTVVLLRTTPYTVASYSKSVRRLDQWDPRDLETLRPLVAPSLRSGRYSLGPRAFRFLNRVDPLVSASNLYLDTSNKKNILQNERTYRDGIPKKQPNKVGMVPQYPYGLSSLYLLPFLQLVPSKAKLYSSLIYLFLS